MLDAHRELADATFYRELEYIQLSANAAAK